MFGSDFFLFLFSVSNILFSSMHHEGFYAKAGLDRKKWIAIDQIF